MRHSHADDALAMEAELREACRRVALQYGLTIDLEQYFEFGPINCHDGMCTMIRDVADALSFSHRDLLKVASHDAVPIMNYCPTGLFFIPSDTGISYNETE